MADAVPFKKSKAEVQFVTEILTSQNPKDIYYQNQEQMKMNYLMFMLVGLGMILYMIVY